jgi:hypothetical protein
MVHQRIVYCAYDDVAFKRCIPHEHRHQVLHQAFVAGFSYGVYVVAMSDDVVGGRILQIDVASIPYSARTLHGARLIAVAEPVLLGWLLNPNIVGRGYLTTEDFPSWVVASESMDLKAILMLRYKLWYAFYKKLKGDRSGLSCFIPMPL